MGQNPGAFGASPLSVDLVFQASEASVGQESGRQRGGAPSGVLTQVPRGRGRSPRVDRLNGRSFESAEGDREMNAHLEASELVGVADDLDLGDLFAVGGEEQHA